MSALSMIYQPWKDAAAIPIPSSQNMPHGQRREYPRLLDGDAFCEVPGLVHIAAESDGDVVGEELERSKGSVLAY